MGEEFFVGDVVQFNADPATDADVGWAEIGLGVGVNEGGLNAWSGGETNSNVAIVVMVVRVHHEDAFAGEKSGFAVRKPFGRIGKAEADATDTIQV